MEVIETGFEGLYILQTNAFKDERGGFQKLFNKEWFDAAGLDSDFKEFYYSTSQKDVIRGMHIQLPPYDYTKLVYVSHGAIRDVVIDLRKGSKTYKKCFSIDLNAEDGKYLYIPKGMAHGFLSLTDGSICNYAQTACYSKDHDTGVDPLRIDFEWGIENPIRSDRDMTFQSADRFKSPF